MKTELALNNLPWLICHKTKPNLSYKKTLEKKKDKKIAKYIYVVKILFISFFMPVYTRSMCMSQFGWSLLKVDIVYCRKLIRRLSRNRMGRLDKICWQNETHFNLC